MISYFVHCYANHLRYSWFRKQSVHFQKKRCKILVLNVSVAVSSTGGKNSSLENSSLWHFHAQHRWAHIRCMEILHRWLSCFDCTLHSPRNGWHTIVDFSRYVSSSAAIAIALITMDELFPTNDITMAVRVPSRFSASGIGFRKLSGAELCLAWDFPLWSFPESQRITASFIDGIRPLKAGLVLSDLVFATLYW